MTYLGTEASVWFHSLTCNFLPSHHPQYGGCLACVSRVRFLTYAAYVFHNQMFLLKHGLYLSTWINFIQAEIILMWWTCSYSQTDWGEYLGRRHVTKKNQNIFPHCVGLDAVCVNDDDAVTHLDLEKLTEKSQFGNLNINFKVTSWQTSIAKHKKNVCVALMTYVKVLNWLENSAEEQRSLQPFLSSPERHHEQMRLSQACCIAVGVLVAVVPQLLQKILVFKVSTGVWWSALLL